MTAPPLLQAEALTKHFPGRRGLLDVLARRPAPIVRAVESLDLDILPGETLGIVGESGCGKSTLARCLVRLHRATSGALRFRGTDVTAMTPVQQGGFHRQVQMVFQDPYSSLNPRMTVRAALAEVLAVHKLAPPAEIEARVAELLDLVHLPRDAGERYPHEFSGGQRQRIGIARALAVQPSVLIADEPVSALDVSVQAQIVNLFLELQERLGLTLVFITHDLRLVRHLAHRVAVMYLGRIVEIGPTAEIFATPRHPYTKGLLQAVPQMRPPQRRPGEPRATRAAAITGELPSPLAPPPGCAFHPRCPIAEPRCAAGLPALALRGGAWPVACVRADEG